MVRRKKKQEEEVVEEEGVEEEGAPAGAEFVPEAALKPRADVYSLILILTFCAFLAGCIIAGNEAYDHYGVEFWVFEKPKHGEAGGDESAPPPTDPAPAAPIKNPRPWAPTPKMSLAMMGSMRT